MDVARDLKVDAGLIFGIQPTAAKHYFIGVSLTAFKKIVNLQSAINEKKASLRLIWKPPDMITSD